MRATRTARLSAVLAGVLLASCQPALFLPRYTPLAQRPLAVPTGVLMVEDGCVWIVISSERYLALWPSAFKFAGDSTRFKVGGDGVLATSGNEITVVGGAYDPSQIGFVQSLIRDEVPERCHGLYWLVTELLPEPLE